MNELDFDVINELDGDELDHVVVLIDELGGDELDFVVVLDELPILLF